MHPLTERDIRSSFVNASVRERASLALPTGFADTDWNELDYLGWRDRKNDSLAYALVPLDGRPTGILLRKAAARSRFKVQCSWCEDVTLPNDVVFYSAKLAGAAGRAGSTIGTLICQDFQCSFNARRRDPAPYPGFDVDAARDERISGLRRRVAAFAARVASTK